MSDDNVFLKSMGDKKTTMEKTWLAHIAEDGRTQTVKEHLEGTGELCASYAAAFGAEDQGRFIGLLHDVGKCSPEFQERLHGGQIVDHASAGALECVKADPCNVWAACCVAGHHGGLPDVGNNNDTSDTPTLFGRIRKALAGKIPSYEMPVSFDPPASPDGYGHSGLYDSNIIRMMYSSHIFSETFALLESGTRGSFYLSQYARQDTNKSFLFVVLSECQKYAIIIV